MGAQALMRGFLMTAFQRLTVMQEIICLVLTIGKPQGAAGVMERHLRSTPASGKPTGADRAAAYEPLYFG